MKQMCDILKFTNNHIHIEDDKHNYVGHILNSIKINYFND